MSSGQRRRVPAEFPRMKDRARGRRFRREQREAWERAQDAVKSIPWLAQLAADGFRAMGEAFGSFGRALAAVGDAIDPPKRSDFALMPAPRGLGVGAVFVDEIQSFPPSPLDSPMANVWTLPDAEQAAIEHNQARYHELQKLRRGRPNTYNETEYR